MNQLLSKRNTLIRRPIVQSMTGLSRSAIYFKIHNGEFPPPVKIGQRCVAWVESEVYAVVNAQIQGESIANIKKLVTQLIAQRTNSVMGGAA